MPTDVPDLKQIVVSLGMLGAAPFISPAKLIFVGYVVLVMTGRFTADARSFIVAAVLFLAAQIIHDDWLRLWLNHYADRSAPEWKQKKAP